MGIFLTLQMQNKQKIHWVLSTQLQLLLNYLLLCMIGIVLLLFMSMNEIQFNCYLIISNIVQNKQKCLTKFKKIFIFLKPKIPLIPIYLVNARP